MPTSFTNPRPEPSLLGRDTGQTSERKTEESLGILKMLAGVNPESEHLTNWERGFLEGMYDRVAARGKSVMFSGKELFRLRDIKDKLVEKGII